MPHKLGMTLNFGEGVATRVVIYSPDKDGLPFLVVMVGPDGAASLLGFSPTLDHANVLMQSCMQAAEKRKIGSNA